MSARFTKKIGKFLLSHKTLILIVLLGVFLRLYRPLQLFGYSHDQDLAGWIVRDIVENKHFRLIGQETSVQGVYIGALWYYLLIPFYLLFNMSPIGGIFLSAAFGAATIASVWFVCSRIWTNRVGFLAALLYAASYYVVRTDREVVPTTPVMLWTVWYLYSVHFILSKKLYSGLALTALLFALTWHLNLALLLLLPVSAVAIVMRRHELRLKYIVNSVFLGLIALAPFMLFELKTKFLQSHAVLSALGGSGEPFNFIAKLDHTTALAARNVQSLLWGPYFSLPERTPLYVILAFTIFLLMKKKITHGWRVLFPLWIFLYIIFFTLNSLNLSEYYLNGLTIVWISVLALVFDYLLSVKKLRNLGIVLLVAYVSFNIYRFLTIPVNHNAYLERSAIVAEIATDAKLHGYPCVSVSYITSPGSDLGYRYLFYMKKLHVNDPKSGSPVYTIVFPHRFVNEIDKSFGALGLLYPDYERYTPEGVKESCSGQNSNLTNPMFGFTQ